MSHVKQGVLIFILEEILSDFNQGNNMIKFLFCLEHFLFIWILLSTLTVLEI